MLILAYSNWQFFLSFYYFTVYRLPHGTVYKYTSCRKQKNLWYQLTFIYRTKTAKSQRGEYQGLASSLMNNPWEAFFRREFQDATADAISSSNSFMFVTAVFCLSSTSFQKGNSHINYFAFVIISLYAVFVLFNEKASL